MYKELCTNDDVQESEAQKSSLTEGVGLKTSWKKFKIFIKTTDLM